MDSKTVSAFLRALGVVNPVAGLAGAADSATGGTFAPEELGYLARYGVTSGEKFQRMNSGEIPGVPAYAGERHEPFRERAASAYLFGNRWPRLAPVVQPAVNFLRSGEENGEDLQQLATEQVRRGSLDAFLGRRAVK